MKTVTGKIVSTKPVNLSKAAKILSNFVNSDNGASQPVAAYLRRASAAFNELVCSKKHHMLKKKSSKEDTSTKSDTSHKSLEENKKFGQVSVEVDESGAREVEEVPDLCHKAAVELSFIRISLLLSLSSSVTGKIVSTKPVNLSKAAKILSNFVNSDNGASQPVAAYVRRASAAFNELVYSKKHHMLKKKSSKEDTSTKSKSDTSQRRNRQKKRKKKKRKNAEADGGEMGNSVTPERKKRRRTESDD
ncbi:hypothetical protein SSX86_020104 [Deinandra increscens subsp. villosa]|uniref:Uncharacterized protein n=1 Tax=Deinandra increscens subsp. villosa TaxID=3103831 RepID=A0AAP0CU21_9ASTR